MNSGQGTMGSTLGAGRRALAEEVPVGYKRTEVGVIPEEWESSSVCAIASSTRNAIVGGPFGSDLVSKDYVAHGVPVIRGQNMSGRWVSGSFVFVTPTKAKSLEANLAYPGDIIFTQRGTLGQVSLVADKPFSAYLVSQSQMKLSVDRKVADPLFLFYFFISYEQQKSIQGRTIQTGVPHINLGILREMPIRLPPLAEQRAIAEALSDVDGLLAALETLIAKKRAIKQAAMQQLLTGKSRLPGFSGAWETTTLGEVADLKNGYAFESSTYVPGGMYQIITIANVQDGLLNLNTVNTISELPSDLQDHQQLGYGDILISMTGNVGRVCIVKETHCLLNQRVGKLMVKGIDQLLLYYIVHDRRFLRSMVEMAVGGAQGNLGKSDITGYPCSLPKNLVEQRAIATILSDMDTEIAALERRRDKTHAVKQSMMQQLLTGRVRLVKITRTTEASVC